MKLINTIVQLLAYFFIVHASFVYAMDTEYMSSSSLNSTSGELLSDDAFMAPLNIFPRIIVDWCIENESRYHTHKLLHYAYKLSNNKAFSKFGEPSLYPFIDICEKLHLSPATFLMVLSTCKAIVNRQPFNPAVLAMTYDPAKEFHNKLMLIDQMPRIVADIARKMPHHYLVTTLTRIMFTTKIDELNMMLEYIYCRETQQEAVMRKVRDNVAKILSLSFKDNACISPHTVLRMAQEMCDWAFEKKPVSSEPYDEHIEVEKCRGIMERFPSTLTDIFSLENENMRALVAYAYMLEHPQQDQAVIESFLAHWAKDKRGAIEYHIGEVLEDKPNSCGLFYSVGKVKYLTDEFIATFTATQIPQSIQLLPSAQALPLS